MYQELNRIENHTRFSQLYFLYYMKLLRFSQTYVESEEEAKNIVQDVFLYLWEHFGVLGEVHNVEAFLVTMTKNRCLNFLKHRLFVDSRKQSLQENEESQMRLYALQQFDENLSFPESMEEQLKQALEELPERCREVFCMSRLDGLKHKEIAGRLNISVNTVENQIAIALKKIRARLLPLL